MLKQFTSSKKTIAGFTLIELLVVVAIIAILASIGIAVYQNAQKRAETARRISSVKAYQSALEQKYASQSPPSYSVTIDGTEFSDGINPETVYNSTWFSFQKSSTGYCASALLQTSTGNCGGCSGPGTFDYSGGASRFCVKNLQ